MPKRVTRCTEQVAAVVALGLQLRVPYSHLVLVTDCHVSDFFFCIIHGQIVEKFFNEYDMSSS